MNSFMQRVLSACFRYGNASWVVTCCPAVIVNPLFAITCGGTCDCRLWLHEVWTRSNQERDFEAP
jgi:hypothetical protein